MVPAGVELIACRVDVVAEWCYCMHSVGRSVLCGSIQVCVGYVYLLVQKYLGALSELFRILGGEVVAGSAFGTFLFDIGVTL